MWKFQRIKSVIQHIDGYQAEVVLVNDGLVKTFLAPEDPQRLSINPNPLELEEMGAKLAVSKNLEQYARPQHILSYAEFRQRFTFKERVLVDNYSNSSTLAIQEKEIVRTIIKDWESYNSVDIANPDVVESVYRLVSLNLLTDDRAAEILNR